MAISLFETRKMLKMVETKRTAETFLRDTFFGNAQNFDTKYIEYDIVDNKRDMAAFADPNLGGVAVQRDGYSTKTFQAPELNPLMVTTAEDLMLRAPGENIYSARSPMDRAAEQLGRDLAKLDDIIARREEWMCAQALMNGGIPIVGEGVNESVSFWTSARINGGSADAGDPFADVTAAAWGGDDADVIGDLQDAQRKIRQNSGINPTMAIMGAAAWEAFAKDATVQKVLDNKRMTWGEEIYAQPLPNGVSYQGKFMGLDIMTYDSYFLDTDGSEKPIFPEKEVLIGSSNVDTFMGYGACQVFDDGKDMPTIIAAPRVPSSWTQRQNPAGRIVQIKSRPLPVIQQKWGFFVIKALS